MSEWAAKLREAACGPPPWPQPPGAISSLDFLHACTRCNDCAAACPHDAIGPLPETESPWSKTPAMNTNAAPCHLCDDLPCVEACEPKALVAVPVDAIFFGLAVVDPKKCIVWQGPECGACQPVCPLDAIVLDRGRPVIQSELCNGCGMCRLACPVWDKAIEMHFS
jgi:ferredoxin-type protein NapF